MKFLIILLSLNAFSFEQYLPPSLKINNKKLVFIDAETSDYKITFDLKTKTSKVETIIKFRVKETGYPVLDFVNDALKIEINGEKARGPEIEIPDTTVRYITKKVSRNDLHTLKITSELDEPNFFEDMNAVAEYFNFTDLKFRYFLERYVPASFEYDQVKMTFEVKFLNTDIEHAVMTNGEIKELSFNHYKIDYPDYYNSSSILFHVRPLETLTIVKTNYKSIDNRLIPITCYNRGSIKYCTDSYIEKVKGFLKTLENDFGPYPHQSLLIYELQTNSAMEHAGAVKTGMWAMRHELDHQWFARGIMPNNGNSGWLDEAIASWGDDDYNKSSNDNFDFNIGTSYSSVYKRITYGNAYSGGQRFLTKLDYKFKNLGGLKPLLRRYFEEFQLQVVSTKDFINLMNSFFDTDVEDIFKKVTGRDNYVEVYSFDQNNEFSYNSVLRKSKSSSCKFHKLQSKEEIFSEK